MAASLQALASATLLLLVLVPHACTAAKTTLEDSCERYAGRDRSSSDYDYDFCVWALQHADNKTAATADALGLARIAARYARATAKATRDTFAALESNETLPRARREAVGTCNREYAAAVRRIGHALRNMKRVAEGSKDAIGYLHTAQKLLAQATGAPARCDAAFPPVAQDSPPRVNIDDFGLDDQIELASFLLPRPWLSPPPPVRT